MEMDDSALRHIMDTQTQMLQQMNRMQQDQAANNMNTNNRNEAANISSPAPPVQSQALEIRDNHIQTPLPESISSPVNPPVSSEGLPVSSMAVSNPTQYGTIATPPFNGGRSNSSTTSAFSEKGFIGGTIAEMRDYDPMRHSREATSEHFAQQTRGIQEQAVNVVGGAAAGLTSAASMFIPGILPSLVIGSAAAVGVGGAASAITGGATAALDYQEVLQKNDYKFINAFESTDELGGIGMGLGQRQEISGFLRDLATTNFMEDPDMIRILEGASQNSLLKSVQDVDSFKKKFTDIVDTVKEITVSLNATLEEATEFMGEMERRGVSVSNMSGVAAQAKVAGSFAGMSAEQSAQMMMQVSDSIVTNTGISAEQIMGSASTSLFLAQSLQDASKEANPELYHYIKNSGGASGFGTMFEQSTRNFLMSSGGSAELMGVYGAAFEEGEDGELLLNENRMRDLMSGNYSRDELLAMTRESNRQLSKTNQYELSQRAGEMFVNSAGQMELTQMLNSIVGNYQERNPALSTEDALLAAGVAQDYTQASAFSGMIEMGDDPVLQKQFRSQVIKEEMDSNAIADTPGLMKRIQYGWKRNVTDPLGDVGQGISDELGQQMQDYQKWVTGIDDRSIVGGELLEFDLSQAGLEESIRSLEGFNGNMNAVSEYFRNRADESGPFDLLGRVSYDIKADDINMRQGRIEPDALSKIAEAQEVDQFSTGSLNATIDQINDGTVSAANLARLAEKREEMDYFDRRRADMALDSATGRYDSIAGKVQYAGNRAGVATGEFVADGFTSIKNLFTGEDAALNYAGTDMTMKSLEKQQKLLSEEREGLQNELMELFTSGDLDVDEKNLEELQKAIESGDASAVEGLTGNKAASALAGKFSELSKAGEEAGAQFNEYDDFVRYATAVQSSSTQLADLLNASGVYSEGTIDSLLGGARERGEKVKKNIKSGKATSQELAEASSTTLGEVTEMFENMDQERAKQLSDFMVSKDSSIDGSVFLEEGTDTVDTAKLQAYIMDTLKTQHASEVNEGDGKDEKIDSKEVKKVAKEHVESISELVGAFQKEIGIMREATDNVALGNVTSQGTRGAG